MKIVILDASTLGNDVNLECFKEYGELVIHETTSEEQVISHIGNAEIIITNKVIINKNTMKNTNIKLICISATGMNNVDLLYAKEKGITVKNVVDYSTNSVVQLTISLALQFIQQVSYYDEYVKSNKWCESLIFTNLDKKFYELSGKTWGIIGLGNIGKKVACIASAFDCNIQYYSTSGMNSDSLYNSVDLETLLSTSDIITIHCALNEKTLNLINKNNLNKIRNKTILLNLGRGGIVNEKDISHELDKREIYFGTDVVSKEPIEAASPLLQVNAKDRLLMTPHIAWASKEARIKLLQKIKVNIDEFIK
jgi:glycerate dehydrogenase